MSSVMASIALYDEVPHQPEKLSTATPTLKLICMLPIMPYMTSRQLKGSVKEPNTLIYFSFPPITQSCSVSNVLFTGGRGVSDFSVLK